MNDSPNSWQTTGSAETPIVGTYRTTDPLIVVQKETEAVLEELSIICMSRQPGCGEISHVLLRLESLAAEPSIVKEHIEHCLTFMFAISNEADRQRILHQWEQCLNAPFIHNWLQLESWSLRSVIQRGDAIRIAATQRTEALNRYRRANQKPKTPFEDIVIRLFPSGQFENPSLQLIAAMLE